MAVALSLAMVGPLKGQLKGDSKTVLAVLPSDSLKLWLCSSTGTGSLPRSDVGWPRGGLQPHSSPSSAEGQLLDPPLLPYQPTASKLIKRSVWASFSRWLPDCKEIHIGGGVRLDQAKFHCMFISAQNIALKRRKQSCSRWERLFIASHGYLARFTEGLSSCTQGIMLSSNLRKHPWDFQAPLEIEIQQETTNTPRN